MNAASSAPPPQIRITISRQSRAWQNARAAASIVRTAIRAAASNVGHSSGTEVSVALVSDEKIRALNASWRSVDRATNVLSFPAAHPGGGFLGDIALAYETIAAEAGSEARAFEAHLAHLAVHGFLHLIGYDHEAGPEAERMEALETSILAGLGIADPYAPTVAGNQRAKTRA
jgi:probable rRNA maturation factor